MVVSIGSYMEGLNSESDLENSKQHFAGKKLSKLGKNLNVAMSVDRNSNKGVSNGDRTSSSSNLNFVEGSMLFDSKLTTMKCQEGNIYSYNASSAFH